MEDSPSSDAVIGRRALLAVGGMAAISFPVPARPRNPVPVPHGPSYPLNRPLYYVNDASRAIALTIDDGPDPTYTPQILRLLRRYGVTATFSMIGINVAAHPHLARSVAEAGHRIANHTWTHADLVRLPASGVRTEMARASDAIHAAAGVHPSLFRAPYGAWSPAVIKQCEQMKMVPLDWSVDPRDWARPGVSSIARNIMDNTRPGSIILEHDGGGNRSQTVAALRIVLPWLLHRGYHFQTP
jgi:peptidoglycan/xylan/chitin deacetylase (PgdA/CDA1 family)